MLEDNQEIRSLFNYASGLCASQEMCRFDIATKLSRRGVEKDVIEQILDRLEEQGFIDEVRYCRAFVHDKIIFDRWGRRKISSSLSQKGIPSSLYHSVLEDIDEKEYQSVLREVIDSKRRSVKGRDEYDVKMKLARFAVGRGFEPHYVFSMLDVEDMDKD